MENNFIGMIKANKGSIKTVCFIGGAVLGITIIRALNRRRGYEEDVFLENEFEEDEEVETVEVEVIEEE